MKPQPRIHPVLRSPEMAMKKARAAADKLEDLLAEMTRQPCPKCGRNTLVTDAPANPQYGIVVYCERAFCSFKPLSKAPE